MSRGRPATPTAVRELQGNPGRRPLNANEPVTPPLAVNPPEWMEADPEARAFWYEVGNMARAMNVAMESDRVALELLAMCLAEVRRAYQELQVNGHTDYTNQGGEKLSPHFAIMSKMIAQAMAIMREFGMTPAARSKVTAMAKGDGKSKLSRFLGGGDSSGG